MSCWLCVLKPILFFFVNLGFLFFLERRVRSLYAFEGDGPEDLCELTLFLR